MLSFNLSVIICNDIFMLYRINVNLVIKRVLDFYFVVIVGRDLIKNWGVIYFFV